MMNRFSLPPYEPSGLAHAELDPPIYSPTTPLSPASPQYTTEQGRRPTVHEYHLLNSRDKPWATLTVLSNAGLSKQLPKFFERNEIVGSFALNLDRGNHIQAITISVKGRVITSSTDSYTFLDYVQTLWCKSNGDPRTTRSITDGRYNGKLVGSYVWPFSFPFPEEVALSPGPGIPAQVLRLPHTFMERNSNADIRYDLIVRISRGKLRTDDKIKTPVAYIPTIIPFPPSTLRQHAYLENAPVPGPELDPEGWCTLRPTIIRGQVFKTRPSEVKCILSLAKPLCYTRGTVIPCSLIIQSLDNQTLDLFASPEAVDVRLRRRVKYLLQAAQALSKSQNIAFRTHIQDVETAVWWTSSTSGHNGYERRLEGEIHLPKDLQPSSSFPVFTIEYFIVILPFKSVGFVSDDTEPSLAQPVEVATAYAPGPRPRAYTANPTKKIKEEELCIPVEFDSRMSWEP